VGMDALGDSEGQAAGVRRMCFHEREDRGGMVKGH